MNILDKLRKRLVEIDARLDEVKKLADDENRQFSAEETTEVNSLLNERDDLAEQIKTQERIALALATNGMPAPPSSAIAAAAPGSPPGQRIEPVASRLDRDRFGFHTFGDYLVAVMAASPGSARAPDQRLIANAPTTYGTEGAGPDGGFAVPPDYRAEIVQTIMGETSLLPYCDVQQSSSNTFTFPKDEATPWGTSGVRVYWVGEGSQITESKPALTQSTITLHKLAAMVSVTEELASDAPALDRWVRTKAPEKIGFEVNRCIVGGTGAGQPLGILSSPCLVSVAKEGSQTADTVNTTNLVKMWSRCYAPARQNAVWLINQDVEPQLMQLMMEGTSSSFPVYLPPGGFSQAPYGTLFGRPVIPTQACETLGDLGDVILAGLGEYMAITRQMRQEVSVHLYFDYDVMAFKFILRIGGQPKWSTTASARDGSATYSPFVALAERA